MPMFDGSSYIKVLGVECKKYVIWHAVLRSLMLKGVWAIQEGGKPFDKHLTRVKPWRCFGLVCCPYTCLVSLHVPTNSKPYTCPHNQ